MLQSVTVAIARAAAIKPFDALASKARDLLPASAVLIVDVSDGIELLGACPFDAIPPEGLMAAAARVPVTIPAQHEPLTILPGARMDAAPPFSRVINISLRNEYRHTLCMIFPLLPGIEQRALARFEEIGGRRMGEIALMRRYREDLKRYVNMLNQMERIARVGLWELDMSTQAFQASDEARRILDIPPRSPLSRMALLRQFDRPARRQLVEAVHKAHLKARSSSLALPLTTRIGRSIMVRVFISRQSFEEGRTKVAGVIQDVTDQRQATEKLWWTANHDALTALPNRSLFADRFRKALERRVRSQKVVCLILVDVDKFKQVNDTFGHAAGDELLRKVSKQLSLCVRTHDTVARTGGDEFSILLEDIHNRSSLESVLDRIRASLDVRFQWEAHTVNVTLSAGAAIAPDHGRSPDDLTTAADLALYRIKRQPTAALAVYETEFGRAAHARNQLLAEARAAVAANRIVPFYQPQVDIASGRIVGVEALARWIGDGIVRTASEFQSALADHEIGPLIGKAVVDRAIVEIAKINRGRQNKIALSINASAGDLLRNRFLERIGDLYRAEQERGPITVEITEDVILDDPDGSLCRAMEAAGTDSGVSFSLDDFGTGYGSLIHVTNLPISEVKVDRRFVAGLENDPQKKKVIQGILGVARSLGLRVVVEGVETPQHVACINALGGQFVQGFFYSQAIPFDDLVTLVDNQSAEQDAA